MAKKKQELTVEEKLAAALVREDEQPYEVPGNWVWTRLGSVAEIIMGQSPKGEDTTDDDSYMGLIGGAADMGELYPKINRYTKKSTKISQKNDVIISIRATLGRPILSDGEYCLGRGVSAIRSNLISDQFTILYIKNFEKKLSEMATGTTFSQVSKINLETMVFPLPPLAEQQRIVDRIESLFAQLDQAKALIQEALDSFETRKATILHQAFIGALTKKWREEHGVGMESWFQTTLIEQTTLIGDGLHGTPIYNDGGEHFFINGNNLNGKNILIKPETKRVDSTEYAKYKKQMNDKTVLVSINGTLGKTGFYNNEPVILGKSACYFNVKNSLNKFFIRYYLETRDFINYANIMATGSTIKNLSLKSMRNLPINLPSLPEQQEIVRILDELFEKEQNAKELCDQIERIDTIKKTILGKAFRGELGTNVAGEASAVGLLKKILTDNGKA